MKLRTYQAYTMAEALAAVKRDLGSEAVILNTRTFHRGGVLGIGRKAIVEVTATPAKSTRPVIEAKPRHVAASAARRAYDPSRRASTEAAGITEEDRIRTRRLAQAMAATFEQRQSASPSQTSPSQPAPGTPTGPQPATPPAAATSTAAAVVSTAPPREPANSEPPKAPAKASSAPAAQRFILTSERDRSTSHANGSSSPAAASAENAGTIKAPDEMHDELAAIKSMVGQVLQRQTKHAAGPSPTMPAKLFDLYLQLIAQDISEELADTVINEVRDALTTRELDDAESVRSAVLEKLAGHIPVADAPISHETSDGRPLTIALIGPTGVGKTTTLAKLAASYKLRQNCRVGLITSDTYRIAAVDQLRTYANIIGLPLKVALTPAEMRQAVHALSDCDVILIDTAGRGQNDQARLDELAEFLSAAEPHENHLVLSSTANEKVLLREAEAFSRVGIHKIVLTKLDEAVSFGMLINVVRKVGKELSFLTTGQEVPTHIEIGRADRLADLILGGEVHG